MSKSNKKDKDALLEEEGPNIKQEITSFDEEEDTKSVWLITFTDTIALMLTFFVLLFSMSNPKEEFWTDMATALHSEFQAFDVKLRNMGPVNAINLNRISFDRSLDVDYLESVLQALAQENTIMQQATITNFGDSVMLSFENNLLFEAGAEDLKQGAGESLQALANMLAQIRNDVIVIGHTDPIATEKGEVYQGNRGLSLLRAYSVAEGLRTRGYDKAITIKGMGDVDFDLIPESLGQEQRYALSRRVDILILDNKGIDARPF